MIGSLKVVVYFLLNRHYIGNRHFPERKLIESKTKYLSKEERKIFNEEYKVLMNDLFFIKLKKRTGKGTEWHISLNPRKLKEIYEMIKGEQNEK